MRLKIIIAVVLASVLGTAAQAQVVNTTVGTTYLAVVQTGAGGTCVSGFSSPCVSPSIGIPLTNYATSADLATANAQIAAQGGQIATANGQISTLNGQVTTINGQITAQGGQITSLNGQVTSQAAAVTALSNQVSASTSEIVALGRRLSEANAFVAAVGAMHDAIPDAGDRFAVRLNSSAVNGIIAGGASFSANLGDGFRASINYAGARGQNAVSAGLNFSFH